MSYALPTDMLSRYDANRLGDLVQDSGVRVSPTALLTDPNLQTALDDAAGMIDAALQRGQKYTPDDLAALLLAVRPSYPIVSSSNNEQQNDANLVNAALWNGLQLLLRLNCDLAYGLLVSRRAYTSTDTEAMAPRYVEALRQLDLLAAGQWIFTAQSPLASGEPVSGVVISQNISLISSISRIFGDLTVSPTNPSSSFGE